MQSAMRELKDTKRLSLDWNIKQSGKDRPRRPSPRFTLYPYIKGLTPKERKGNALIYDTDGTEWEAKYEDEASAIKALDDFQTLCEYHIIT